MADRKVGTVHNLWTDDRGQPAFLGVKTGWLGLGKNHVVPVHTAHVNDAEKIIRLPFGEDTIKDAPSFDADADLEPADQEEIHRYYGLKGGPQHEEQRAAAPRAAGAPKSDQREQREDATIQLREETVHVGKRQVETGGVRLRKIIRTETVQQPVELQREEIVVERVPACEGTPSQGEFAEQTMFIPLRREEPVVEKQTRVREEVRVGKKKETERRTVSESVRKEDVQVENEDKPRFGQKGEGRPSDRYIPKERGRER